MKKFLLYVVVIVTLLFLGFTIYYLSLNDETISLNISTDNSIYLNKGDELELPITWTKPSSSTTLDVSIDSSYVLSYNAETKIFKAESGGFTTVTITPSNTFFGPFAFEVYVGDGNVGSPYVINDATALANMEADKYYILGSDIDLTGSWTPIADFSGNFNGNGHTIYNLRIDSTSNAGFFANILTDGVVENVRFERVAISGEYDNVGAVAGINNGTVGKIEVLGSITNTKNVANSGLLVGYNQRQESYAVVNMCSVKGTIVADGYVGGLVGKNVSSIILNSKATITNAELSNNSSMFGGIIGLNESTKNNDVYYPSAIAKAYTIVENATGANIAAVVGESKEDNASNPNWYNKYEDIYYVYGNSLTLNPVKTGAENVKASEMSNIVRVTKLDLLDIATYTNFNFDSVWTKEDNKYAELNYNGTYENIYIRGLRKEISIEDGKTLIDFLQEIKTNLSVDSVYSITEDVVYDLEEMGCSNWVTVAPNRTSPMNASIRVADGVTCTIKNLKLSGTNNSFFGYLSANSSINGIVFEDVELSNSGVNNSAVVATGLVAGAKLENITVRDLKKFDTTAELSGIICATNQGNIINCDVNSENDAVITLRIGDDSATFGGIVGRNNGVLKHCDISDFKIETNFRADKNGGYTIGGIVGIADASMKYCSARDFRITSTCEKLMYVGGVAGYVSAGTIEIYGCTVKANMILGPDNDNYVGGVIGYVSNNVTIKACAYMGGEIKGRSAAGVAGVNYGYITECYSVGTIMGHTVAGLVDKHYADISNCYTLCTVSGESKSSVVCGVVGIVPVGSTVDRCFSSAEITGSGKKFAEANTYFRRNVVTRAWYNLFDRSIDGGDFTNCIIINYGSAEVQALVFHYIPDDFIRTDDEECKGKDDYKVFREEAGFDGSIWNFDNVGEYPTLKVFADANINND